MELPPEFVARLTTYPAGGDGSQDARAFPAGADWLRRLPALLGASLERWNLAVDPDSPVRAGYTSLAVPVLRGREPLILKVVWPHPQGRQEHLALRTWAGHGAVRLVAADPGSPALLLERLDGGSDLTGVDDYDASRLLGSLMRRLHVPAPPQFQRLPVHLAELLDAGSTQVPRRFLDQAKALLAELDTSTDDVLLHGDLHYLNVLAAPGVASERAPDGWLAIDPQPWAGPAELDLLPMLRNRVGEYGEDLRFGVRHRIWTVCDAAGLDDERARAWTSVHATASAIHDEARRSLLIAVVKAMAD